MSYLLGVPPGLYCRQAKVADFDGKVVVVEEDVVALEIPVDNVFGMEIAESEPSVIMRLYFI